MSRKSICTKGIKGFEDAKYCVRVSALGQKKGEIVYAKI